jgi:MFS family permease
MQRARFRQHLRDARALVAGRTQSRTVNLTPEDRIYRTNLVLHVMNGAFSGLSDALTSTALVMTAFLSQLTTSNFLIALLSPLRDAGWYLPQLFLAPWVDGAPRKVTRYRAGIAFRLGSWVLLVLCTFFIQDRTTLLAAVFICISVFSVVAGFAGLPFLIITAKIIPPDRRGTVFGLRQFIGGALGVGAGGAVALILGGKLGLSFPQNYAVVFAVAALGYAVSYLSLSMVREKPDDVTQHALPMVALLRKAWHIARGDQQFRFYIAMRVALLFGGAGVPFLTVYAKRVLGVNDGFIGTLVSVTLAASLLSNVAWARLSDRRGNRLVMILASVLGLLLCAVAVLLMRTPPGAAIDLAQVALIALFLLSGAMTAGINLASNPIMIEFAAPGQQPLYIGLGNTILGIVILLTSLEGVIVDRFGFALLFAFCGSSFILALAFLSRMRDPRVHRSKDREPRARVAR